MSGNERQSKVEAGEPNDVHNGGLLGLPGDRMASGCVHHLFELQAARTAQAIAIDSPHGTLSYAQLNARANQIAHYLIGRGVGERSLVGVCIHRSPEMIAVLYGILKAGAAYVPLDPSYPLERLTYMARAARLSLIITSEAHLSTMRSVSDVPCVTVETAWPEVERMAQDNLPTRGKAEDLVYVVYTSGSTGRPKGVAMVHRAIVNLVGWQARRSKGLPPAARTLQFASLSFDVSAQEIFATTCSGGTLVLMDEALRYDSAALWSYLSEQSIHRLFLPCIALQQLAEIGSESESISLPLKEVITAGEQLLITPLVRRLFQRLPGASLDNQYGPSETHVATAYLLPNNPSTWENLPPIGHPIDGAVVHLLDSQNHPVAPGQPGEIFLGGVCLAQGYLHQPELTSQRFVTLSLPGSPAPQRLYKTGDLAERLPDGGLRFLGRADDQVKIRGFRIELGEIETVLAEMPGIKECVVTAHGDGVDKHLIAFVVPAPGQNISLVELRDFARSRLADYMLPARLVILPRFPLTPSGKVDRRSLIPPPLAEASPRGIPPQPTVRAAAELEDRILSAWRGVLGHSNFGAQDNFFEVGGHSLLLARLRRALENVVGVPIDILSLLQHTSVSSQTTLLAQRMAGAPISQGATAPVASPTRPLSCSEETDIAIIGMSGRFPGAQDIPQLWANVCQATECITRFTDEELLRTGTNPEDLKQPAYVRARGTLAQPELFDAAFFGFTPRDAEVTDPQHRLFLECAWEAFESAGYVPEQIQGRVGVYAGSSLNTYFLAHVLQNHQSITEFAHAFQVDRYHLLVGNDKDYLATRVAYKFDLRGPAITIQTACSTSLVAVIQACGALQSGQCDVALAGGVSISFPQQRGYLHEEGAIASADGQCRAFDARATGTVFGAGVGAVLLKRLADAVRDRDPIVAVIKGGAINNDGRDKASFSAPSIAGQAEVIRAALAQAGVSAETIGYVEAHGTGTPLGDPIEVKALSQAFRQTSPRSQYCALGSVKTNIGHLEAAAGVTGLIKAALAVKQGVIPPTVHFTRPNPLCEFEGSPFYVPTSLLPWPKDLQPRRAGVSSFGVGGTNAHVVLEQPPAPLAASSPPRPQLLAVSARSESALQAACSRLAGFLQDHARSAPSAELTLENVAFTLQAGRKPFRHRRRVVASSLEEAVEKLTAPAGAGQPLVAEERPPEVVFLFPGQGAHYVGMGSGLYASEPAFREAVDRCAKHLEATLWTELQFILLSADETSKERAAAQIRETRLAQPALFIIEYALAQLWISWGIQPAAVIGHSIGEFVAGVLAGAFSLEDALRLVVERARLMQALPGGSMLAVRRGAETIEPLLPAGLSIAAYNSSTLCTVSGPTPLVNSFAESLESSRIASKLLESSHAFHSSMMDPVVGPFTEQVRGVSRRAPNLPWFSTCHGKPMTHSDLEDPAYWARQLRQPVRFQEAVASAFEANHRVFLEVGPGQSLGMFIRQHPQKPATFLGLSPLAQTAAHPQAEALEMLQALGTLWTAGCSPDWEALHHADQPRRVALPTYPFERKRFWIEPTPAETSPARSSVQSIPSPSANDPTRPLTQPPPESPNSPPTMSTSTRTASPAPTRADHLAKLIREIVRELSGTVVTDDSASFVELGLDSLFLTQASHALRSKFGIKVTFRQLLESTPSVRLLSAYLDQQLAPNAFPPEAAPAPPPATTAQAPASDSSSPALAFGLSKDLGSSSDPGLNRVQQAYLSKFIENYVRKTAKSKELTQKYRQWYADPRTASSFRRLWKEMVYQIVVDRSLGAHLWDIDGNRYTDLLNGFGPNFLGHSSPLISEALKHQIDLGIEVGPQSPIAGETAKMFCELTGNERASFVNTGSEAVYAAMRLARAVTGKDKIVIFAKDYHGNFDEVLARAGGTPDHPVTLPVAAGIPKRAVQDMIVLEYGSPASLAVISSRADEIAAVMVEPVQSRRPELQPFQFNQELRKLTEQKGIALIFDEVITGVRHRPDGAQGLYGVKADIATYGKVVGGGMPIGIVAGKAEYMDIFDGGTWQYGDDSFPSKGATFFAGTFVRHPLAIAATHAMLKYLLQQPAEFWNAINRRAARLATSVDSFFVQQGIPIRMPHCCSQMYVRVPDELEFGSLLFYQLRHRGVFILENFPTYLTAAHTDRDVDEIIQAFKDSTLELQEVGLLNATRSATAPKPPAPVQPRFPQPTS